MFGLKQIARAARSQSKPIPAAGETAGNAVAVADQVDVEAVLALAEAARRNKKFALAPLYYEKAIELWGDHPDHWASIAFLQTEMGRYEDAENSLLNAMRLAPEEAKYHLDLAELHLRQKHFTEAEASCRQAARTAPDWSAPNTKLLEIREAARAEAKREAADEDERIRKAEQLDLLSRSAFSGQVDPALFAPIRLDLTHNHRPTFVKSFVGVYQRTRWGSGPVVRGIGSLRGHLISIVPYHEIEIYIDGVLVHRGELTVGPVQDEQSDRRLQKFAYNALIDFTRFSPGWHEVTFRGIGLRGGVERDVDWAKEDIIVDVPLPEEFFEEASARVPLLDDPSRSIIDQVRALPSVVAEASPNSYPGPIRNVAILRLDGLGDVAVSVPFFLRLRELLPEARLVVLASSDNADSCRTLGIFDEVIEIEFPESPFKQGRFLAWEEQLSLTRRLADYKFDLAITGMVSDGPRQLSVVTGAPVTIGFGGDDLKTLNIYYDTRDPKSGGNILNYAARYQMLAKALEVWLDSGARVQRRDDLSRERLASYGIDESDDFVVMHTGSRIKATEWPGYAILANRIVAELGMKLVYIANDERQKQALSEQAIAQGKLIFLAGLIPFDDFDAFLSHCSVFVGNDSGPGHLATLRGAKAIRIISARLGGSEWKSEMAGVCIFRRMPCAGCGSIPISKPEECTFDIACVKDISVDEVFGQVVRLSGRTSDAEAGVATAERYERSMEIPS